MKQTLVATAANFRWSMTELRDFAAILIWFVADAASFCGCGAYFDEVMSDHSDPHRGACGLRREGWDIY